MSNIKNPKALSAAVYLLFLATGSCGLIYQVVWQRYLLNVFGSTIYSISTVLAAFMGGLALGSALMGMFSNRVKRPLAMYGILEIVIGLSALSVPLLLRSLDPIFIWMYRDFSSDFTTLSLCRFVFIFFILLIPTTMMGATLPLLSNFVAPGKAGAGLRVGLLYALNTWGAVAGAFSAGFFLLPALGVSKTVWLAVAINGTCGVVALLLSGVLESKTSAATAAFADSKAADQTQPSPAAITRARWVIATYAVSGFAALGLEVAWTRALVFSFEFLKNTTYAFTGMLTTFLIGLALGSALMTMFVERVKRPFQLYALLQIAVGISSIVSVFILYYVTPTFTDAFLSQYDDNAAGGGVRWMVSVVDVFIKTGLSMLLPTFIMGLAFPVAVRTVVDAVGKTARSVGQLYSFNTVGAIIGSFLVGFVLLPYFGICKTIFLLGALQLIMGIVLMHKSAETEHYRRMIWTVAGVAALLVCAFRLPTQAHFQRDTQLEKVIFYEEGPLATVSVGENTLGYRTIYVDNVGVAGTEPMLLTDQKSLAHVPMLMLDDPKSILTVGFGSGGASYSYTLYKELEDIHCIEITRTVIEASPYLVDSHRDIVMKGDLYRRRTGKRPTPAIPLFDGDPPAWKDWYKSDPRYKIILDDARSYLHFTDFRYDVIATDCTDLRYKSNANLYDLEYFQLCHDRITDDGMVVVWMPMGGLSPDAFACALATFQKVFPHMDVFFMNNQPTHYVLLLGKKKPITVDIDMLKERIARPGVARDLAEIQLEQPDKLLSCFITGCEAVAPMLAGAQLNTGDNPYLEFESPRYGVADAPVLDNLDTLFRHKESPVRLVAQPEKHSDFVASLTKYYEAAPHVISAHRAYREMRLEDSCRDYMAARTVTPEDSSLKNLLNYDELARRIKGNPTDTWARIKIAALFAMQNRDGEAVTEYLKVLDLLKTVQYTDKALQSADRQEVVNALVALYERNGQPAKADALRKAQ